MAELLTLF